MNFLFLDLQHVTYPHPIINMRREHTSTYIFMHIPDDLMINSQKRSYWDKANLHFQDFRYFSQIAIKKDNRESLMSLQFPQH